MTTSNLKNSSNLSDIKKRNQFGLPSYSFSEELINAITHGLGIIFSLFALVFLLINSPKNFKNLFPISIYTVTLLVLYTISTLYHAVKVSKLKGHLRKLDHCSIFLLIAGTYTPLCSIYVNTVGSSVVLACVWITALVGIILNVINVNKFSKLSLACYIIMGWSVVFIAKPVMNAFTSLQLLWLLAGGIFYTVGAVIYVLGKKVKYMHSLWHLFVLAGSVGHFMVFIV